MFSHEPWHSMPIDLGEEVIPVMAGQAIEEITLQPGMTAIEYAATVIQLQTAYANLEVELIWRPKARQFVETIDNGFKVLVEESSIDELEEAQRMFIDYGMGLKSPSTECGIKKTSAQDGSYKAWVRRLRMLAGLSQWTDDRQVTYNAEDDEIMNSIQFWRTIYLETVEDGTAEEARSALIFGPGIETKSSSIIEETVEALKTKPVQEVFDEDRIFSHPDKVMMLAFDSFLNLVREAATAGWPNAQRVLQWHETTQGIRQLSSFGVLNLLGNTAATALNRHDPYYAKNNIEDVEVNDISQAAKSVSKCMYLIFELSREPVGHSSANYLGTGLIIAKLLDAAAALIGVQG